MTSKPSAPSNPLLEVNPSACLFVLGPAATGSKSCKELLEAATAFLQAQKKLSLSAKRKLLSEIKKSDTTDVGAALQRAIDALREMNIFLEWLQLTFQDTTSPTPPPPSSRTLVQLYELQKQGAMLACTQLDRLPGTRQATLHDDDSFKTWLRGGGGSGSAGDEEVDVVSDESIIVLHLCGLYSQPRTIWTREGSTPLSAFGPLKKIMQERLVLFVGFNGEIQNRDVLNFLDNFYSQSTRGIFKYPPIMFTTSAGHQGQKGSRNSDNINNVAFSNDFLTLQVQEENEQSVGNLISCGSKKNFSVARGLTDKQTVFAKYQAFLLFNEKQSFRKLGEIIYRHSRSGEIYVRRDALTVMFSSGRILYSNIITYGGNGLRQLWELVFADESSLLGKGLVGFGLQNSAIVWIRGRPEGLGDVTDVNTTYAGKNSVIVATMKSKGNQMSTRLSKDPPVSYALPTVVANSRTISSPPTSTSVYNITVTGDSIFNSINLPPPPKLIKITDNTSTVATHSSPPLSLPPMVLSPPPGNSGEAKCMQAILDLQERISQQLNSSSDNLSAPLATPSTMAQLNDRHGSISRSFCPPCYCTAGAPELLLDIIGQTTHVKMYEHNIQVVELPQATQNSSLTRTPVAAPYLTPRSSPTAVNRKRKRPSKDDPPPSLFTLPTPTPTPTPITRNQTNVMSNVLMAAPSPNYCLALNSLPVMLVNSTMSLVQPIPALPLLGSGLPSNQILCYMTPEQFVKPLNPTSGDRTFSTEQQTRGLESTFVTSLQTPLSLSFSPPSRAESAIDPSPVKIERVCNEAVSHIVVSSRKQDAPEAVAMTGESDCSDDECEETSLAPNSTLASAGSVQLWVFLLELLLSPDHQDVIHWTGQRYEFRIAQPAALARLWGCHRNKPQMTYEKMSRALRYYYSRGIIESVRGRRQTFCFSIDVLKYVTLNKDQESVDYLQSCCRQL